MIGAMLMRDNLGPFLLVPLDDLRSVAARLIALGVAFREDEDATTCGGPVFGVLRFEEDVALDLIEKALRAAGD